MTEAELDDLLVRYADGTLDTDALAALEAELARSGTARARMRELAEQVFAIAEAGRCREARSPGRRVVDFPTEKWPWLRRRVLATLAAAAVLTAIFSIMHYRSRGALLEVVGVYGGAAWSDGQKRVPLVVGARLPAGTIETEGETATAEVRLADGTHFTMHGCAEAVFSDGDGKQVTLKRGKVTAFVAKQETGRPLRVRTPAANLEVLGTVFSLDAVPQRTSLAVSHGRVRLRRLVDGREVEVGAEQHVAASLVSSDALVPQVMKTPPIEWALHFDLAPESFTGTWIAAAGLDPAFIAAEPVVEMRHDDGRLFVHHSVIVRSASNSPADAFASLTANSVLRLRLRIKKQLPLQLMIATRRPNGSFGGNFESMKLHPQIVAGPDWQTLEVPIRGFVSIHPERGKVAAGNQANVVIISTLQEQVGMEISEISIAPAASAQ